MTLERPRRLTFYEPSVIATALELGPQRAEREMGVRANLVRKWRLWARALGDWPNEHDQLVWKQWREAHDDHARRCRIYKRDVALHGGPLRMTSIGALRRLQALQALGWTRQDIGAVLGWSHDRVYQVERRAKLGCPVSRETFAAVCRAYDALSMRLPERPSRMQTAARLRAQRRRWPPPLAWDDETIDDPAARPHYGTAARTPYDEALVIQFVETGRKHRKLRHDEAAEAYRRLRLRGFTGREIEERWGLNPERYKARGGEVA
jgi:hypothetical protein